MNSTCKPAPRRGRVTPYPVYKDSGVEWLGKVPQHWEVRRLATVAELRVSNVDKHLREGESPVRLCNYLDVYGNERITADVPFMAGTATGREMRRFRLALGDVLVTKDSEDWSDIGVPALVEYAAHDLVCGYHLAMLRPDSASLDGGYLFQALNDTRVAWQLQVSAAGVTRYGLSQNAIRSLRIPLPPLSEQTAIARFLDDADRRIRGVIRAKERLIELLEEERQAIIHEAVTGRIDVRTGQPYPAYRNSGVEWLGEVPEHWEIRRLGATTQRIVAGTWGHDPTGRDDIACVRVADFDRKRLGVDLRKPTLRSVPAGERQGRLLEAGDLLLEKSGGGDQQPVGTVVQFDHEEEAVASNFIGRMRVRRQNSARYVLYLHSVLYTIRLTVRSIKQTTGIQNLDVGGYLSECVPLPPLSEQIAIARFMDAADRRISARRATVGRQIALLREYRTRLIADVVTGKLDVREAAARLPEGDAVEADRLDTPRVGVGIPSTAPAGGAQASR